MRINVPTTFLSLSLLSFVTIWLGPVPAFANREGVAVTRSVIEAGEKAAPQSMGVNIRQANLIVAGEYKLDGKIVVEEVIKGDDHLVGKTITLASPIRMGCRSQPVPGIKRVIVLLHNDPKAKANHAIEIYDTPDQMAMLRCLIPIYNNPSEHGRLKALAELFIDAKSHCKKTFETDPSSAFKKEFLWAIGEMREPANFEIVKELYGIPAVSAKDKLSLQEWIAMTGDERAVPVLYQALKSDDQFIVSDAVCKLIYFYPGADVDGKLLSVLKSAPVSVRPSIVRYLLQRGHKIADVDKLVPAETPFQKAEGLDSKGKWKEAQTIYVSILESHETNGYIVRAAALKALKHADPTRQIQSRILKSRLGWLTHDAGTGNYLEVSDTAAILRQLRDPGCVDGLVAILSRREFIFARANKIATMAIVDLGSDARKKATAALLKQMSWTGTIAQDSDEQLRLLLEFAWIHQSGDDGAASKLIGEKPNWASSWQSIQPLLKGLSAADEGAFLVELLKAQHSSRQPSSGQQPSSTPVLNPQIVDWIVYRLGDLREKRAAEEMIVLFQKEAQYSPQTISEAIESIGGEQIVNRMQSMALDAKAPSQARAVEVLSNIEREKSLPILRKVLKSGSLDAKVRAINAMSRFGSGPEKVLLSPMLNYWTGERPLHYWLMLAMAEIRQRCP